MFLPGLVSITFRQLAVAEIIALVTQADLAAVEWGGDIHAPHGDEAQARAIARLGADAGLRVAAYGSYYRVGHPESGPFEAVLASAVALGAPLIRVWAGRQGSGSADETYFQTVVADSHRIADLAQAEQIGIVYEFHANTLTDTNAAAVRLLQAVDHANVRSLWQPPRNSTPTSNLAGLEALRPWLDYLAQASRLISPSDHVHYALLEFVQDDAPEAFLRDAATLVQWLMPSRCTGH